MISSTMANLGAVLAIWIPPARKAEVEDNSEAVLDSAATDAQHVRDPEHWMEIDETKALCRCVRVGSTCTQWNLLHILRYSNASRLAVALPHFFTRELDAQQAGHDCQVASSSCPR